MKQWLVILIVLLLVAPPGALCKSKRVKDADVVSSGANGATTTGSADSSNSALPTPATPGTQTSSDANADMNKTLDDVLAKPVDELRKEAPKPALLEGAAQLDTSGVKPLGAKDAATVLQGSASLNGMGGANGDDPDQGNEELSIAWDKWRNRLLRFIQMQVQASVNSPASDDYIRPRFDRFTGMPLPKFPLGTEAWFDCEVTRDHRIVRCLITQSSGFPAYDHAVISGIRALDGSDILEFPRGSRRTSVRQEAGIRTATQSNFNYYHFGDVERYNVPQRGY